MAAITQLNRPFLGNVQAFVRNSTAARPRAALIVRADKQGVWLPGVESPPWLNGSLPGDRAFDPLVFGSDEGRLKWFVEAEKTNGRWAMAAVAGILGQELLGVTPRWFAAGTKDYNFPLTALLAIEFLTLGALELKRYQGWKATGESGFLNWFPFDPLKLNSEANAVKEIKNGRLAMVAFVGFAVQALVTRQGPIENLTSHLKDPFGSNFLSSIENLPNVASQTS